MDPDVMMQVLLQIYGEKSGLPDLLSELYQKKQEARESADDLSHRLDTLYEKAVRDSSQICIIYRYRRAVDVKYHITAVIVG